MRVRVRVRVPEPRREPHGPENGRWTSHRWPWRRRTGGIPLRDVSCSWRSRTFRVEVLWGQPPGDGRSGDDGPAHAARGHGMAVGQREPRTAPGACLTGRVSSTPELLTVVRREAPGSRDQQEKGPSSGTRPRGPRGDEPCRPGRLVTRRLRKMPRTGNGRGRSYRVPQRREDTRPEATMAATQSARSMSLASFRAGHAVRVDAERAERGGSQPAARNPAHRIPSAEPRDRIFRPVPAHPGPCGKPQGRGAGNRTSPTAIRIPALSWGF